MFLRPYRTADKRILQQLFHDTVHTVNARDYSTEQVEAWAPALPDREYWAKLDTQHCFVIENHKLIVGFASLSLLGSLDFLYVHKDFQGRGIGSTLLKQLERTARKKGISAIVVESNITARCFFEKKGFNTMSEQKTIVSSLELLHFSMQKLLPLAATNNT